MTAKTTRPPRTHQTARGTNWLRRASYVIVSVAVLNMLLRYPSLPETIPTHYNLAGEADGWGARWNVLLLAGIAVVLIAGLGWLSHYPRAFNHPREITEENAQAVYKAGEELMVWITAGCSILMSGILSIFVYSDLAWVVENGAGIIGIWGAILLIGITIAGIVRIMRA